MKHIKHDTGFYILKYFMETEYKLTTYTELLLRLQEYYGVSFSSATVLRKLNNLIEMKILKREAKGYALTHKILSNCHEQFEKKRREFF
jgi:arginine repressor